MKHLTTATASKLTLAALAVAGAAALGPACSSGSATSGFGNGGDDASVSDGSLADDGSGGGADGPSFHSEASVGSIQIQPADPTIAVTITDGVVTVAPVTFTAIANGSKVNAIWAIDRGELGAIDGASGVMNASGSIAGVGTITAKFGSITASTSVTVTIHSTQNGRPSNGDAGGGGVGGEGLGGAVDGTTKGALSGAGTPPANAQELGWLYPYDKTVWPRGILAPLLQWQTTHSARAVYIHLKQKLYEFEGWYAATAIVHHPIDATAWKQATQSNAGDALHVEVKIYDGTTTTGPIAQDWTVAPGPLKGTVYYDSYNSHLGGGNGSAAVLAIKPGAGAPQLALPGATGCVACHELSADGSTIFAARPGSNNYSDGSSYDLKNGGATITSYTGNAPDGTSNDHKFVWSAVYPDGTFAMAGSNYAREAYTGDSHLFRRSDGNQIAATGWDGVVTTASMPTFSNDGKTIAFNYWAGSPVNGVSPGGGRSLVAMDFACGAADGGIGCGAPPYAFSNAREIYRDTTSSRYAGWPAFLPDGKWLLFQSSIKWGTDNGCTATPQAGTTLNCVFATWHNAQAELWLVDVPSSQGATSPIALDALDGKGYLPANARHPSDAVLNFEPTVNPISSGGYYWVVFTSRRMYGNVAAGDPYDNGDGTYPIPKKLWVAAIDLHPAPGKDPSHPAFYLPGQELNAGNMRGHWVVDPCKANGSGCETGDECCNGFCRHAQDGGALVCSDAPQGCAQEFDKCTQDADCCGAAIGYSCVAGRCARPTPK